MPHPVHRADLGDDPLDGGQVGRPKDGGRRGSSGDAGERGSAQLGRRGGLRGAIARLPGHHQGRGRRRRKGNADRHRRGLAAKRRPHRAGGGRGELRIGGGLPGALRRASPAHRIPDLRRQARKRGPPGRARMLDPATPPETHRGVAQRRAYAGAPGADGQRGRQERRRDRLRGRGDDRISARARTASSISWR